MSDMELHLGDCLEKLQRLEENSIDTVITDPPYELGFMGKAWDDTGVSFQVETWEAVLRVAKPGAMMLCFGGTRTWHRLACAVEDAGWQIRDTVMWLYGSGFPKSKDISKAIDEAKGAERTEGKRKWSGGQRLGGISHGGMQMGTASRDIYDAPATDLEKQWDGWGSSLKPAWEPILICMKPLDGTYAENAEKWGVAGLNIDGGRIGCCGKAKFPGGVISQTENIYGAGRGMYDNRERCKDSNSQGRWPANLILDEETGEMLDEQSGDRKGFAGGGERTAGFNTKYVSGQPKETNLQANYFGDSGGASRFFYCSKASRAERDKGLEGIEKKHGSYVTGRKAGSPGAKCSQYAGTTESPRQNTHPTVKPLALMEYLCKLTATPTGGIVLDPFMGSGTTGIAAIRMGRRFIGIEKDEESFEIAKMRIEAAEPEAEAIRLGIEPERYLEGIRPLI